MTTELRARLEREASRVHAAEDAKTLVLDRAERRMRHRRIRAGVLGLVIGFAVIGGAFSMLRVGARIGESTRGGSWTGLWPQTTYADALSAQQAADAGDANAAWQLNGAQVVKRFAIEHFGWGAPTLETIANAAEVAADVGRLDDTAKLSDPTTTGPVRVLVTGCPPGGGTTFCPASYVTVQRLIRDDATGIWSVTAFDTTTIGFASPTPTQSA